MPPATRRPGRLDRLRLSLDWWSVLLAGVLVLFVLLGMRVGW